MIWAILAFLGVPLWLIALGILGLVLRNRRLRKRQGDIPVRILSPGKHWRRGHALWISDVFTWRSSPAAWGEDLARVNSLELRAPDAEQRKKLRRVGADAVVASLSLVGARVSTSPPLASTVPLFRGRSQTQPSEETA